MKMKKTTQAVLDHLTAENMPEIAAAIAALTLARKRFTLMVWDDETSAAAVMGNAHPDEMVNMLRQTTDKIVEANAEKVAAERLAAPKH